MYDICGCDFFGLDRVDPSGPADGYVMEVYENQRKTQPWGWGSGRKRHLRTSDPGRFSDSKGENRLHVKVLDQVTCVDKQHNVVCSPGSLVFSR